MWKCEKSHDINMADDDDYYDEDDEHVEWYEDYKQRKTEKAETK